MANGHAPTVIDVSSAPTIEDYGREIAKLFSQYYPASGSTRPSLFLEPSRAITSSAQTLLLEVLAVKPAAEKSFNVICNGGRNIAMPTGYEYHELFAAAKAEGTGEFRYDLFGPLCHPGDVLFKGKLTSTPQTGGCRCRLGSPLIKAPFHREGWLAHELASCART
jgi:diaminopimelate decarboxylase